jgi:DNA-directed RNA polymerase subunit F
VLVIEEGVNDRGFLEDLFANQHIVTINIIWLPDGSTETRVVLRSRGSRRLSKKRIRALTDIAKKVRNMDLRVEYSY